MRNVDVVLVGGLICFEGLSCYVLWSLVDASSLKVL